jgi:hypothetical protein
MQVFNLTKVVFKCDGIEIAKASSGETIPWADLAAIRYRVWRGGHFWEFKLRSRDQTIDYYVDGLPSAQLEEVRKTISLINLPGVIIETEIDRSDITNAVAETSIEKAILGVGSR